MGPMLSHPSPPEPLMHRDTVPRTGALTCLSCGQQMEFSRTIKEQGGPEGINLFSCRRCALTYTVAAEPVGGGSRDRGRSENPDTP